MRTARVSASTKLSGPRRVAAERRRRTHLRDLCDEVLASFRLASDRDPISEQDREAAKELLPRVAPPDGADPARLIARRRRIEGRAQRLALLAPDIHFPSAGVSIGSRSR